MQNLSYLKLLYKIKKMYKKISVERQINCSPTDILSAADIGPASAI